MAGTEPAPLGLAAKILTVSTRSAAGEREDLSGPALASRLAEAGFTVIETRVVPDGRVPVAGALREMCGGFSGVVVTTGGTGFAPSDQTPEGTAEVLDRYAPGLAEATRSIDPRGRLSRGVAGTVGASLVLNLPGSPGGAVDGLNAVIDVLPHALALLAGEPGGH